MVIIFLYLDREPLIVSSFCKPFPTSSSPSIFVLPEFGITESKRKIGFCDLFQTSHYQFFFHTYLERPKTLLEDTDDTIDQIALKVGFDSYNDLSTAFKKADGFVPTEFRNRQSS
jgi:AraC-like DNA-binding protein